MKKVKLLFTGAISLVVFGFLLPQPIQALLVIHTLSLCMIVGIIQGMVSRMFSFAAMMELTKIDYLSCQNAHVR